MGSASEIRRYNVTSSLVGGAMPKMIPDIFYIITELYVFNLRDAYMIQQ